MNLSLLLQMAAEGVPQRAAVTCGEFSMSYGEMLRAAQATSMRVGASGAEAVCYLGRNGRAFSIALFAAAIAGRPFIPLNYRLPDEQLRRLVQRCAPAILIANSDHATRVSDLDTVEIIDTAEIEALHLGPEPASGDGDSDPDTVAVQLFTSGTTGEPKRSLLRHRHLSSYVLNTVDFIGAGEREALLVSVPPYHIAAVASVLTSVYGGRRMVLLPEFKAEDWVTVALDRAVTHAMVVPTMLMRILDELDRRDVGLPALRHLSYGGGRMPRALVERAMNHLPNVDLVNAYGLTETSSTIAMLGPQDHRLALASFDENVRKRLSSVGRPLPGVEISIRDRKGVSLPSNVPGEVWVRGGQISGEYLEGSALATDGWLRTRDAGWMDEDGYLFVDGRLDDVIVRGAENISPSEVEERLLKHPAVVEAAVVGIPDDRWGEKIVAAVVVSEDVPEEVLKDWVRTALRSTKTPERVHFLRELPYNETGKLLRRSLRETLAQTGT